MGFKINPYDRCVANKVVKGKQLTVAWYVDDCKVSHVDADVVSNFINDLKPHFGELQTSRGKKHIFLGINFEIKEDKSIELEMKSQLQEAIEAFSEDISKIVTSPAQHHLFEIREDAEPLCEKKADVFYSVVAKLLYIMKRVRPDIEPTIAFLSTRVSCSTKDDWNKLKRVLEFIKCTIDDKRIIGVKSLSTLYTWVDAAYAVHPNMRSHTGGCMSFGKGTIHARSSKQRLNTKSSTEAELVGVSEYLPYNIWIVNFLSEQGYHLDMNELKQDNQSAIRMEKTGETLVLATQDILTYVIFLLRTE